MKTCEALVSAQSNYFVYSPSKIAKELFFYPLQCGTFYYLPGYSLTRSEYDSFLVMYLVSGSMTLQVFSPSDKGSDSICYQVSAGNFLLVDCYHFHRYEALEPCEVLWCHFDGSLARGWYQQIVAKLGHVFCPSDSATAVVKLKSIYDTFVYGRPIKEPMLSKYLSDLLTVFLTCPQPKSGQRGAKEISEEIISYISEHFKESIGTEELAKQVDLSAYHFIRTFKRETGFTPHEYITNFRLSTAKYLLKNSTLSVKDICYECGFSNESVFCSAFKHHVGVTPSAYREGTETKL